MTLKIWLVRLSLFCFLAMNASAQAVIEIPSFTPNVVDSANHLQIEDVERINQTVQEIKNHSDMRAAVYIIPSLEGETIEALSERAFRKWELGEKGKDNGLLLVIALKDRQSRIETGYGLEGDLPDVICKRVLDADFRKFMRMSKSADAIIAALKTLSAVRAKQLDPNSLQAASGPLADLSSHPRSEEEEFNTPVGFTFWFFYCLLIFCAPVLWRKFRNKKVSALLALVEFRHRKKLEEILSKKSSSFSWVQIFLAINPGIFIFIFLGILNPPYFLAMAAGLFLIITGIIISCYKAATAEFNSVEEYQKSWEIWKKSMISKGLMEINAFGVLIYTEKW